MEKNTGLERQVIELIATDRLYIPISSMGGKLDRRRPKLGKAIDLTEYENNFVGERVYARIEENNVMKARGLKEGIDVFSEKYPRHGKILRGYIEEERQKREINLYFGVNENRKLTADDYMDVMKNMGFTEATSRRLYPELIETSRNLSKKRDEERSVLIG